MKIPTTYKSVQTWLSFLVLFLLVFLTLNRHSRSGVQNYHSEIWSDKAGYYVYLPAFFIYGFDVEQMPAEIDSKTGNGFRIEGGKVKTKYTCGVALMQSPFFLICHYVTPHMGYEASGFSLPYHKAIDLAAVFYTFFSLLLLFSILKRFCKETIALLTVGIIFFGTNFFYYSVFETGMSHTYSFFLSTCFLYLWPKLMEGKKRTFLLIGIVVGLIVAVRPINMIFLPAVLILYPIKWIEIRMRLGGFVLAGLMAFMVLVPQFLYWKYTYGSFIHYAYEGEGFTHILGPKVWQLWFSTHNGWFVFNPMWLLLPFALHRYYRIHAQQAMLMFGYLIVLSCILASWHDWHYGCAYGSRPFVEFYPLLAFPLSYFFAACMKQTRQKIILSIFLVVCIGYNVKLIFSYDGCWPGGDWDAGTLWQLLTGPTK
jgi:hypothetical protein